MFLNVCKKQDLLGLQPGQTCSANRTRVASHSATTPVPVKVKHFDLNIDKILENWDVTHAIREIIANAIDESLLTNTSPPQVFKDNVGWWHIRDCGRGLKYQDLIQSENQEKIESPNVIGKFGIGLKDALATFERKGVKVLIRSQHGDISLTRASKHSFEDIVTLHASVAAPSQPLAPGTDCCLYGVTDAEIECAKGMFLTFSALPVLDVTKYGEICQQTNEGGSIFINGLRVGHEPNFLFSYNITSINSAIKKSLNRERQNLGRVAYGDRVRSILLATESTAVAELMARDLEQISHGTSHDELLWQEVQVHAVKILNTTKKVLLVSSSQIIDNQDMIDEAKACGHTIVAVPSKLAEKIEGVIDLKGNQINDLTHFIKQRNDAFDFKWVDPDSLSPKESEIWSKRDLIFGFFGGRPKCVRDVRISETMIKEGTHSSSDADGLWDTKNGWIIIKRSVLGSMKSFAGILLHEAVHARSGETDVTRAFETYLTMVIGDLASRLVALS